MPWAARLDAEGILYHVIILGIERRVFWYATDKDWFVERRGGL